MPNITEALTSCMWFNTSHISKRNLFSALLSGFLFWCAWWIVIDTSAVYGAFDFSFYICGILSTISLLLVNTVTDEMLEGNAYDGGCIGPHGAKLWLFTGFVIGFAAIIASIWIMVDEFTSVVGANVWPGVALLLQNSFILVSSLVYKFGRTSENYSLGF